MKNEIPHLDFDSDQLLAHTLLWWSRLFIMHEAWTKFSPQKSQFNFISAHSAQAHSTQKPSLSHSCANNSEKCQHPSKTFTLQRFSRITWSLYVKIKITLIAAFSIHCSHRNHLHSVYILSLSLPLCNGELNSQLARAPSKQTNSSNAEDTLNEATYRFGFRPIFTFPLKIFIKTESISTHPEFRIMQ